MDVAEYTRRWKFLKDQVKLVQDPVLQKVMMAEFRKRALDEWGFDPETSKPNDKVVLDDWEKELVEDINDFKSFGVDNREEKRVKENREARARMWNFIDEGNTYSDLPDYLQNKFTKKLYLEVFNEWLEHNLNILKK